MARAPKEFQAVHTEDIYVYTDDFDDKMMIEVECITEGNKTPVNVKLRLGTKQINQLRQQIGGKPKLKRVEEKLEHGTIVHYVPNKSGRQKPS